LTKYNERIVWKNCNLFIVYLATIEISFTTKYVSIKIEAKTVNKNEMKNNTQTGYFNYRQ